MSLKDLLQDEPFITVGRKQKKVRQGKDSGVAHPRL
jgi:hypothetical protein